MRQFANARKFSATVVLLLMLVSICLAACGPAATPQVVEKVVKETVVVSTEVEKMVEVTKQVVVTATPVAKTKRTDLVIAQAGLGAGMSTLDPNIDTIPYNVTNHIFDPLVWFDENGKATANLATSWSAIDDLTWEFKLRDDVKWHDGTPFTAQDVKFTMDRILNPDTKARSSVYFKHIASTEVVDDHTVRFKTNEPYGYMAEMMVLFRPVSKAYWEQAGNDGFLTKPIGTGPYKFVEWVKDDHVTLEANEDYWGGEPALKKVTFKDVPDGSTRVAMLMSGEADLITNVPPNVFPLLSKNPNYTVTQGQGGRNAFVGMNSFAPPYNDVRVRQALNYAVDWDKIIKTVMAGYASRVPSFGSQIADGYDPALPPYPYDPEKAKQLLAEAGYPDGFETEFIGPVGWFLNDKQVAQAVAGYLEAVGVKSKLSLTDRGVFWSQYLNKEAKGLYYLSCGTGLTMVNPQCIFQHYHTKGRPLYYNSSAMDAKIDAVNSAVDPAERARLNNELQAFIKDEAPFIFGYDEGLLFAQNKDLNWENGYVDELVFVNKASWK